MHDDTIAEIRRLHQQIHRNDPNPQNANEEHAAIVLEQIRSVGLQLIMQGVTARTLEITFFYHWLRLLTLYQGISEAQFERWASDMGSVMSPLITMLKELEPTLVDDGPTVDMQAMSRHVQLLKDALNPLSNKPLSQEEIVAHTDLCNRAAFTMTTEFLHANISPVLIASAFLYYWLRLSTINANAPESFFQTLERQWDIVTGKVDIFVDTLAQNAS